VTAAWIGHSTVLLNVFGTWIITDPVFSEQVGVDVLGLFMIGPTRRFAPALAFHELPPVDVVLLSHAHMDHFDLETLRLFDRKTIIVAPRNTTDLLQGLGFSTLYELDWGKWSDIAGVRIEGLQVRHNGWRYPWERDRARGFEQEGRSYNGYLITCRGTSIVFAGDTAWCEYFAPLRERLGHVDLAILPIGGYVPHEQHHSTPEQAVAMADQMGARTILPIHWKTFVAGYEELMEPMERFSAALRGRESMIALDDIGKTWTLPPPAG
jgi:L-ascorbate metabolism protein UlaG (beta-lactamase superfamily)